MAEENTRDETSSRDPAKAPTLPLDHLKLQGERRVATERLLARLKAIDATQDAQTPRAYASRYIREQEPVILRLLGAGVGTYEILSDLATSFPSIPKTDLRHAIAPQPANNVGRSQCLPGTRLLLADSRGIRCARHREATSGLGRSGGAPRRSPKIGPRRVLEVESGHTHADRGMEYPDS